MLNQVVLVGRIQNEFEVQMSERGKQLTLILGVNRNYKNLDGEYDIDYIPVKILRTMVDRVVENCSKGDLIGVKGRLTKLKNDDLEMLAEKVTFLSSKKGSEE